MAEVSQVGVPEVGARLQVGFTELCEAGGGGPYREDVLLALDADNPVTAEGREALVCKECVHQVVMVWFEQDPDEDLQWLSGTRGEVGRQLVCLLVVSDDWQQAEQLGRLKQVLEIHAKGGLGDQTRAELVFEDAVEGGRGRVAELGDTFR